MVSAGHPLVKFQPALFPLRHCLMVNNHFCRRLQELRSPQQAEFIQLVPTSIGSPEHSGRSASSCTVPTHAAPRVPLLQRRITNPLSDQTPVPGSALHPHPTTAYHARGFGVRCCRRRSLIMRGAQRAARYHTGSQPAAPNQRPSATASSKPSAYPASTSER